MVHARLLCLTLVIGLCACGAKKETPSSPAAPSGEAEASAQQDTKGSEAASAEEQKPEPPKHSVKPRPDEPPQLPDGLYEGSLTGPLKGKISLKLAEGKVEEANANAGDLTINLRGKVSAHRVSMGGRQDKDFLRLMGHGSDKRMSGSWMAEVGGKTHRGSWSAERKIVAATPE